MTRIPPPLLGYNNNVRYLGRTFHIQTEDSGTKYARIMTHLFIDGGRIVKTKRTEYAEFVGQPDMAESVRRMMKEQHKSMFLALRAGEFDELIERVANGEKSSPSIDITLSQVPRLRADSLPSLSFGSGEEARTTPGLAPTLVIGQEGASPDPWSAAGPAAPEARAVIPLPPAAQAAVAAQTVASAKESAPPAAKRTSGRHRKAKPSMPPSSSSRRARLVDDPTPVDLPETAPVAGHRPSERPPHNVGVRPTTLTSEAIDPRKQSIFGEATAGKQTLDDVILSFLEDEES